MPVCPNCAYTVSIPAKEAPGFCWKCERCRFFFCIGNVNYKILEQR